MGSAFNGLRFVKDEANIVLAAVDDWNHDDARNLVRMLLLHALDDLRQQATSRAHCNARFGLVVDLPSPSVDRANRSEVVARRAEPVGGELAGEGSKPLRIGSSDDDLAHFIRCRAWATMLKAHETTPLPDSLSW